MDSASKADLLSTVSKQNEQLKRYESRLRDVVAAYKGLVKQKEALETSLAALNKGKESPDINDSVATLTESLATLVAEKSRMEEAFQIDKKASMENHQRALREHHDQTQAKIQQHGSEVENLKAKLAYEKQEREKERFSHTAILKELQQKINSERKYAEKLEETFVADSSDAAQELEKRVRDLNNELEATQRKLNRAEARTVETPQMLVKLQEKIALLQQGHTLALREEQIKAKRAEETARKVCASQEERVAILEAKLNELSQTVGEYDLQSRRDQQLIQQLRQSFNEQLLVRHEDHSLKEESNSARPAVSTSETDAEKIADTEYLQNLLDKVHLLKKELMAENERLGSPINISALFSNTENNEKVHAACQAELQALKTEFDFYKLQTSQNKGGNSKIKNHSKDDVAMFKSRIRLLQDKIEYMNKHLEDVKEQYDDRLKHQEETHKQAISHHQNVTSELKGRILTLEKQLQAQRARYTVLLEEREDYLRSRNDRSRKVSMEEDFQVSMQEAPAPPHMLHYAQELARKDLDITTLRKEKHILDGQLRDCQRDYTIEKEHYKDLIKSLKDEVKRLHRIQSREGANLEYLKNVVLSYLLSSDYAGKKHMLNAIAAVLNFTDGEKNSVYKLL